MVENDESVFGCGIELDWHCAIGGIEACYDMTDVNGRLRRATNAARVSPWPQAAASWRSSWLADEREFRFRSSTQQGV